MEIKMLADVRPSAGKCIYCGSRENLTLEHIIPYGLYGRIEYPKASCKSCAKIINEGFEAHVMRKQLGAFRSSAQVPERKRRKRDYKFRVVYGHKQGDPPPPPPKVVGGVELPRTMLLMRLMPPEIFIDRWPKEPAIWYYQNDEDLKKQAEKNESTAVFMGEYDHHKFCRLIAKIGHGLAQAYMPPSIKETFDFLLPDLILNGSDNYHHLIGGNFTVAPPVPELATDWDISNAVRGKTEYIFTRIRLFAFLGAPDYIAVVARRPLGSVTWTKDPVRFPERVSG